VVPISERLWAAMEELKPTGERATSAFVLTRLGDEKPLSYWAVRDKIGDLYRTSKVKQPSQPWHALRHAFCTTLAAAGVDVAIIKELAGHKSIETTMRYIHVNDRQKRDAISKAFGCNMGAATSRKREKPRN